MKKPVQRPSRPKPDLGVRLEALYEEMQQPAVQKDTARALAADPEEFGAATVRAARRPDGRGD